MISDRLRRCNKHSRSCSKGISSQQCWSEGEVPVSPGLKTYRSMWGVSAGVVPLGIVLTRVFALRLWRHLAFLAVDTTLVSFALSGLYLAMRTSKRVRRDLIDRYVHICIGSRGTL